MCLPEFSLSTFPLISLLGFFFLRIVFLNQYNPSVNLTFPKYFIAFFPVIEIVFKHNKHSF